MRRYSRDQLSRILSASAALDLNVPCSEEGGTCCIEQAAHSTFGVNFDDDERIDMNRATIWDHRTGVSETDPESVLKFLERKRMA